MNIQKEIKKEDGSTVILEIDFSCDTFNVYWRYSIAFKGKGKRKFSWKQFDDYEYRSLTMEARRAFEYSFICEHVGADFLLAAKKELLDSLLNK